MVRLACVRAATIVETVVASTIILMMFVLAAAIFSQIYKTSSSMIKTKAIKAVETYALQLEEKKSFEDGEKIFSDFVLRYRIVDITNAVCVKIEFTAFDFQQNEIVRQQKILVIAEP